MSENHPQIYDFSFLTYYYGKYLSKFLMTGLSLLCDGILIFLSVLSFGIKNYFISCNIIFLIHYVTHNLMRFAFILLII